MFDDIFSCSDTTYECCRQTNGQTDRWIDRQTPADILTASIMR